MSLHHLRPGNTDLTLGHRELGFGGIKLALTNNFANIQLFGALEITPGILPVCLGLILGGPGRQQIGAGLFPLSFKCRRINFGNQLTTFYQRIIVGIQGLNPTRNLRANLDSSDRIDGAGSGADGCYVALFNLRGQIAFVTAACATHQQHQK